MDTEPQQSKLRAMSPYLQNCPNEILEAISEVLGLRDICSLRQTCRALAVKCTQNNFRSYFRLKHVDITGSALRKLVEMTRPGMLGCYIEILVLFGVVNNTKLLESILEPEEEEEEGECDQHDEGTPSKAQQDLGILKQRQIDYEQLHKSGTDVSLLSEAFSNIVTNSKIGKLLSLSLGVIVYREDAEKRLSPFVGGSWRLIWQSAADTFHTVMRSLAASSLPIEKLNIFNSRQLQRCSLASNELGSIDFKYEGLAISLASLKSLSVSFSGKVIFVSKLDAKRSCDPADEIDWELLDEASAIDDVKVEAADEGNFNGLAKILKLCSQLEEIELHQYWLGNGLLTPADLYYDRLFSRAAEMNIPINLRRIELRGSNVKEQDLLSFIQRTHVSELAMSNVSLSSGTFRSVFDYCTSETANMEALYFHKLLEQGLIVYFDEPGPCQFPPLNGPGGTDLVQRAGAKVKQRISYNSAQALMIGSPATMEYRRQRWIEYGPPERGSA